ncbi:Maf family protein [Algibacillus agarilyticus]|uniref:Maf family protein n=1 Tax=Algibacillus agarilyticus TaxID=2234133 RepID=UPI000DD0C9DB|nr:Maf family protein [Algibacillus agarilyticus]
MTSLYLASQSPRRKALLQQLGHEFTVLSADIDETVQPGELPETLVTRLATEKALAILPKVAHGNALVVGSDTIVVSPNGEIFGKPIDYPDAKRMLEILSGQTHLVMTAVAICSSSFTLCENVITEVSFCPLTADDIEKYWQTGEPQDKAGSYGIQGIAGQYVTQIKGNYSAVVGLPLYHTQQLIMQAQQRLEKNK